MTDELLYTIAFTCIPGFKDIERKAILQAYGSATALYAERKKGAQAFTAFNFLQKTSLLAAWPLQAAEAELNFIQKHDIQSCAIHQVHYPDRLLQIPDPPTLLFIKGSKDFNLPHLISIVGSRKHTIQVRRVIQELLEGLTHLKMGVISGMALGVDGIAHEQAIVHKIPTWGVLAHGLDQIYPPEHRQLAVKMLDQGGLLTEYRKETVPLPFCFPKRNRIVAGMSDATIVVETDLKGGSMITANLAFDYNREVFAVPGKIHDPKSTGCLLLIKNKKASVYHDPIQLLEDLAWPLPPKQNPSSIPLYPKQKVALNPTEQSVLDMIAINSPMHRDLLCAQLNMSYSELSGHLLALELAGQIHLQAGNSYTTG